MRTARKIKRVLVALWTESASGRDILSGVFRYVRDNAFWDVVLAPLPNGFRPEVVDNARGGGFDGVIASDFSPEPIRRLVETTCIPVVSIGDAASVVRRPRGGPVSSVSCDDRAIGVMAARHFLSLGSFNAFGFVRAGSNADVSNGRERGFVETLARGGRRCELFTPSTRAGDRMDDAEVASWLSALPKPAALLCHYDPLAVQILNVCRDCGIAVPRQVSVLGVDNDPLLCDFAVPPLSSIMPDHERAGFLASRELDRMFTHSRQPPRVETCPPIRIAERESTHPLTPAGHLVREANAFIDRHLSKGIDVADVVAHLKVSRRLADLRFREIEDRTIAETLEARRLEVAERLLRDTALPVRRIASDCGYASANTFGIAFRRRRGMAPGKWRKANAH